MDIRIGAPPPVHDRSGRTAVSRELIEARVLSVRPARRQAGGSVAIGTPERRRMGQASDPRSGRVLVLMIPDGQDLPQGIERGDWRVLLRFVRR